MSFQPIKRILPKAMQDAGIQRQVTSARVLEEAKLAVIRLWGEEKAAYIHAVSFGEGTLKLQALAPAALQELKMWETRLLNEVNRALGSKTIHKLICASHF